MKNIIVGVPADSEHLDHFTKFEKSFHHFHPDIEVRRFDNPNSQDRDFWLRAKPIIASQLFSEGYQHLILADADQIVLGSLSDLLEGDYDIGVVLNDPTFPIGVWDLRWPYYNNGLVVLRSEAFAEHWLRLCFSNHFPNYQYREQDLLNIMCSDYMNYRVKKLDGEKIYGEWAKPFWTKTFLRDDKVFFNSPEGEKQLCIYHSGGGNTPDKMNYKIRFPTEVSDFITNIIL